MIFFSHSFIRTQDCLLLKPAPERLFKPKVKYMKLMTHSWKNNKTSSILWLVFFIHIIWHTFYIHLPTLFVIRRPIMTDFFSLYIH